MMTKRDDVRPVKGFKATDKEGVCAPGLFARQKYRVGKTYSLPNGLEPVMCDRGFHFCDRLYEVFCYYPTTAYTRVFVVEALGTVLNKRRDTRVFQGGKRVTDKIRIVRELSSREILDQIERESVNKKYLEWQRGMAKVYLRQLKTAYRLISEGSVVNGK